MAKGFLAEIIPIITSLFLLAIILLVFFGWLAVSQRERASVITSAASSAASLHELLALLQTIVIIQDKQVHIADALVLAIEEEKYRLAVHDEVFQYLSLFHPGTLAPLCGWLLTIEEKKQFTVHSLQFATPAYVREHHPFTLVSYRYPGRVYTGDLAVECSQY